MNARLRKAPVIGVLTEGTAATSFLPSLRESFAQARIVELDARRAFDPRLLNRLDLLVLPGVPGEQSHYPRILPFQKADAVMKAVEGGLCLFLSCAATYHFSARKSYHSPHKTVHDAHGLGILHGTTWGPVDTGADDGAREKFSDTRLVRVAFNDGAGATRQTGVLYANGPAYVPAKGEEIDVVARYADVPGQPVAAGGKAVGRGYVLFEGVLPEMKLSHMGPAAEAACPKSVARLRAALGPHDSGRQALLDAETEILSTRMRGAALPYGTRIG